MSDFTAESEDLVLDRAIQYLTDKYGEKGLQYRSALFSSVTGLEPDQEFCDEAMESILDLDLENATALCMDLEGYIREFPNQTFDVVVCSHLFEYMKHQTACSILETLKQVIGPDSVCLFATTFTDSRRNAYTAEFLQEAERTVFELDEKGFEEAVDDPDRTGVCLFSRPWMERFLQSCGLKTKLFQAYPFDGSEAALYVCEPAEGTLLRRSCGPETASGKVCFMNYYYRNSDAGMYTADLRRLQTEEGETIDEIKEAFEIAGSYLYDGKLPFPAQRHYRKTEIRCGKVSIADSHMIVSVYPETGIVQVCVCLNLEDVPCDDLVYLRQIRCAEDDLFTIGGEPVSIPQVCEDALKECGLRNLSMGPASIIIEINQFGNCTDPQSLTLDDQRCLYGILTGDEGYLHVPQSLVEARMTNSWSSRDFARVIAAGGNYVLLNFNRGATYADYIDYQLPYAEHYFGELDDYFTMDAPTAGIDHGLFFSAEKGQLIHTILQRLSDEALRMSASRGIFSKGGSKQLGAETVRMLNEIDRTNITELGALDKLILNDLGIDRKTQNLRCLLSALL